MINENEGLVEWELAGEREVLTEKSPQYHFVHHKPNIIWLVSYPDRSGEKPGFGYRKLSSGMEKSNEVLNKHFRTIDKVWSSSLGIRLSLKHLS